MSTHLIKSNMYITNPQSVLHWPVLESSLWHIVHLSCSTTKVHSDLFLPEGTGLPQHRTFHRLVSCSQSEFVYNQHFLWLCSFRNQLKYELVYKVSHRKLQTAIENNKTIYCVHSKHELITPFKWISSVNWQNRQTGRISQSQKGRSVQPITKK